MDDDDCIGQVESHDFELDAPVVLADPDQPGVGRRRRGDLFGVDGIDDVQGMGLTDAVAPGRPEPPQLPIHSLIVAQKSPTVETGMSSSVRSA